MPARTVLKRVGAAVPVRDGLLVTTAEGAAVGAGVAGAAGDSTDAAADGS
jgi:hypothetical protein